MAIRRACTYSAAIPTPEDPANYSEIIVLFSQDQELLVKKKKSQLSLSESGVLVTLTQSETALFKPSKESPLGTHTSSPAYMQIRAYKSDTDAPGSECWKIDVYDSLSDEILDGEEDTEPVEPTEPVVEEPTEGETNGE